MIPNENANEQERNLEEMDYKKSEDILNTENHIAIAGDGKPISNHNKSKKNGD